MRMLNFKGINMNRNYNIRTVYKPTAQKKMSVPRQTVGWPPSGGGQSNPPVMDYACIAGICFCNNDDDCNDMFENELCGSAGCNEYGCWCMQV